MHTRSSPAHRRGSFSAPTPRKEERAINLPSQRVSASQDKTVHLNNFNTINVNNLAGTEIYGKVLAFGRFWWVRKIAFSVFSCVQVGIVLLMVPEDINRKRKSIKIYVSVVGKKYYIIFGNRNNWMVFKTAENSVSFATLHTLGTYNCWFYTTLK